MPVSYNTFERLKDRGLAAFKSGDYKAAKPYLMQAADAIIKIAAETDSSSSGTLFPPGSYIRTSQSL